MGVENQRVEVEVSFNGMRLGSGEALCRRVRAILLGETWWIPGDHRLPPEALHRVWQWKQDGFPEEARALSLATARLLDDEDAPVIAGAVRFFLEEPEADDGGALGSALVERPPRWLGSPDPLEGAVGDLRSALALATAADPRRVWGPAVLDALRDEVLRPSCGAGLVSRMAAFDGAWLLAHAGEVIAATPEALRSYVLHLALAGKGPCGVVRAAAERLGREAAISLVSWALASRPDLAGDFLAELGDGG